MQMCPICSKSIRNRTVNSVPSLGEFVERCLRSDREEMQSLQSRKQLARKYQQARQVKGLRVGLRVDIRDSNYIWCEGTFPLSKA